MPLQEHIYYSDYKFVKSVTGCRHGFIHGRAKCGRNSEQPQYNVEIEQYTEKKGQTYGSSTQKGCSKACNTSMMFKSVSRSQNLRHSRCANLRKASLNHAISISIESSCKLLENKRGEFVFVDPCPKDSVLIQANVDRIAYKLLCGRCDSRLLSSDKTKQYHEVCKVPLRCF